jgi:hypothetical protein
MSATWLLALGDSFKAVRDEPRPYRMALRCVPRFAGQNRGRHEASETAAGRLAPGKTNGGAAAATGARTATAV